MRLSPHTYNLPESRLSLPTVYWIEGKKFHIFLSSFFQSRAIRYRGTAKPGLVPPSRDHGMAKIAQSDYIFRDIGATLRARCYVVCVKNARSCDPVQRAAFERLLLSEYIRYYHNDRALSFHGNRR